jgi:hypothetical protein
MARMSDEQESGPWGWTAWPFVAGVVITSLTLACRGFISIYDKAFPNLEWPDKYHLPDIAAMIAFDGFWLGLPLLMIGGVSLSFRFLSRLSRT